jgi:hypothetical protein
LGNGGAASVSLRGATATAKSEAGVVATAAAGAGGDGASDASGESSGESSGDASGDASGGAGGGGGWGGAGGLGHSALAATEARSSGSIHRLWLQSCRCKATCQQQCNTHGL